MTKEALLKRDLLLECITLSWMVVGTVVVVLAALAAHFFALAIYVLAQGAYSFLSGIRPETSIRGVVWLAATLLAAAVLIGLVLNAHLSRW